MPCTPVSDPESILKAISEHQTEWVFIDECQFFTIAMVEMLAFEVVDKMNINVIAYGLLSDYKGKLFEGSQRLVECAYSTREIKNQCSHCNNKANRNMRLINAEPVFTAKPFRWVVMRANKASADVAMKTQKY